MDKHKPSDEMIKDLDNLLSKLNAMEIVASDDYQKNSVKIMRALVEGQMHSINEFPTYEKGIRFTNFTIYSMYKTKLRIKSSKLIPQRYRSDFRNFFLKFILLAKQAQVNLSESSFDSSFILIGFL